MKILLINKFHYIKGGSETYYFGLGELLKKYGHEVVYFSMKDEKNRPCAQEKYFVENVDFNKPMSKGQMAKAGLKMLYSFEAKDRLEQLIREEKPDIAHLNIFQSQLTASVVDVLHKYRIPMVYTMHDLKALCPCYTMLTHGQVCEECAGGNYLHCIQKRCMKDSLAKSVLAAAEAWIYHVKKTYNKFDLIITPSDFYKRKLEAAGITQAKIVHIPNFLPESEGQTQNVCRGEYFLYFGRLSREKGILTLLEAYQKAAPALPLYLVGTGPIEQEIKEKIAKLSLENKVKMLGFKQGEELRGIVAGSLCVILPSEWYENGPYSAIESLQLGRPLIGADIGGIPELIDKNGFIFHSGDAEELAKRLQDMEMLNDAQYQSCCKASLDLFHQKYALEKQEDKILQLYNDIRKNK